MADSPTLETALQLAASHAFFSIAMGVLIAVVILWRLDSKIMDKREPPLAPTNLPILGHLLGLRKYDIKYLEVLRRRTTPGPAFTMKTLSNKTYIITSPSLSQAALRCKTLSLEPLSARIMGPLLGLTKKGVRQLGISKNGSWLGSPGMAERRIGFKKHLAPGEDLSDIGMAAGAAIAKIINEMDSEWLEQDLYVWLRDAITIATGIGLYGPYSPVVLEPSLVEDIWTFDRYQLILTINLYQSITAPKGLEARERLVHAFERYLEAKHEQYASHAIRTTIDTMRAHDVTPQDVARVEIFNTSVATVNTTPTAVWMIINILADSKLHENLRAELQGIITELPAQADIRGRRVEVDISRVSVECPLFLATYQEALRIGSIPVCNRSVLEDTLMVDPETAQEVLLKKGQRVVVPTFMLHMRESFWGNSPEAFDPRRFMAENQKDKKMRSQAYVPYGGGMHLCPGRHFAEIEILAVAALMILGMQVQMADGGDIAVPRAAISGGSLKPAVPMLVRIRRCAGSEDVTWIIKA